MTNNTTGAKKDILFDAIGYRFIRQTKAEFSYDQKIK
jgi:hypothetical protein